MQPAKTSPKLLMIQLHLITKWKSRNIKNWQRRLSKGSTHYQPQAKTELFEERLITILTNKKKHEAPTKQKIGVNFLHQAFQSACMSATNSTIIGKLYSEFSSSWAII